MIGYRLNNVMIDLSKKERSGSVGVFLKIRGCTQQWLIDIFDAEMYMNVIDKKFRNQNELNFIKGVFFKFS